MSIVVAAALVAPTCRASSYPQMSCSTPQRQNLLHLTAQAVPSATVLACVERLKPGWTYGGSDVGSGVVHFWLDSDRVGPAALDVTVERACDVSGETASSVPGDARVVLYQEPADGHASATVRHYVFEGGCATVRYSFTRDTAPTVFAEAQGLLGYELRSDFVRHIRRDSGLTLCGAEAPPCPG